MGERRAVIVHNSSALIALLVVLVGPFTNQPAATRLFPFASRSH
jgi:hypothetical protein